VTQGALAMSLAVARACKRDGVLCRLLRAA
jgi:hypothetical protein